LIRSIRLIFCSSEHNVVTIEETKLPGVMIITPVQHADERGAFMELWQQSRYAEAGLPTQFVQDNISRSKRRVLRGLHYQWPRPQGKLISVLAGRVFDVAVDIRRGAATFGQWVGVELSAENGRQVYVPEGFAHGFVVLSGEALVHYKCTAYYAPDSEHTIRWDDPTVAIDWPEEVPILSAKDAGASALDAIAHEHLPTVP
jgi:dTDP-4-dehydrorhamnose 3,5-epimerase